MNKKIIFSFIIFIAFLILCNNSYAFTYEDINYEYMQTLTSDNIAEYIDYIKQYVSNFIPILDYNIVYHDSNNYYIFTTLTPLYFSNSYRNRLFITPVGDNYLDYYNINSANTSNGFLITIYKKDYSTTPLGVSTKIASSGQSIQSYSSNNNTFDFCNYDFYEGTDVLVYTKNFDLIQKGGGDIDMTETNNILLLSAHISILLLFFLVALFIYFVVYTFIKARRVH